MYTQPMYTFQDPLTNALPDLKSGHIWSECLPT
jgi:hypothetical protein